MPKQSRPTVTLKCPANVHAMENERIIEFSTPNGKGGLIAIRQLSDGTVVVEPYRLDDDVKVIAQPSRLVVHRVDTVEWNALAKEVLSAEN